MKVITCLLLGAAVLALAACGPVKPMTSSEFRGFCYQTGDNRFQGCDTISVCDEYAPAVDRQHQSLSACLGECSSIREQQRRRIGLGECATASGNAGDWCERYCRTNYPQ